MRILDRYLTRHLILPILFCAATLVFLVLVADLLDHLSELIQNKTPLALILKYYLCLTPFAFVQSITWATLLGTMFLLVNLNTHNELLAMKATGLGMGKILRPLLFIGFAVGVVTFFANDRIVPGTLSRARTILEENIESKAEKKEAGQIIHHLTYFGAANRLYYAKKFDLAENRLEDVIILFFDEAKTVRRKVFAKEARWTGKDWKLLQVTDYDTNKTGKIVGVPRVHTEKVFPEMTGKPRELAAAASETAFLSYRQLRQHIRRLEENGLNAYQERVALHNKLAFPWQNVVIMLIIIPFLTVTRRKKVIALNILICVALVFLFHVAGAMLLAMGQAGTLAPIASAWAANILFAGSSLFLMRRVND